MAVTAFAYMYLNGLGTEKNYKLGFQLFNKSSKKPDSCVLGSLGLMYPEGFGVLQDYKKAFEFLEESATLGGC
ncbi:MAG TPA: hypothetical protein VNK03_04045 [Gammaproteobacteria bacterium]|nr:hypothetical protein [Gammaproteobacteria bacterium]